MSSQNRTSVALFALAVLTRLVFHYWTGFVADDAFITFRYAHNLAAGNGFVYNPGEHVLGTSTPLFTLILSLAAAIRLDIPTSALMISMVASGLIAVVMYRLALQLRFTHWAVIPAILYVFWPRSIVADASGMETAVYSLFLIGAIYYYTRSASVNALALATLATLVRLEGGLLLFILVAVCIYLNRERWWQWLLIPAFLIGPWLVFSFLYFGSAMPNSVVAKLALYSRFGTSSSWDTLVYLMAWHNPVGWIITIGAVFGGWWLWKKQNWGRVAILWMAGIVLFYTVSKTHMFFWYPAPLYPVLFIFAGAAILFFSERVLQSTEKISRAKWAIVTLCVLVSAIGNRTSFESYRQFQQEMNSCHRQIAASLKTHVAADQLVAAEDIGYLGYYSGAKILDRDGLVSPEAEPYNRSGDYLGLILGYKPAWVVASADSPTSGFITDSSFLQKYAPADSVHGTTCRYQLFELRE